MPTLSLMSVAGNILGEIEFTNITTYYSIVPLHLKKDCAISLLKDTERINLFDDITLEDIALTLVIYKNSIDINYPINYSEEYHLCVATYNNEELWKVYIEIYEEIESYINIYSTVNFIIFISSESCYGYYILMNPNGEPIEDTNINYSDSEDGQFYHWEKNEKFSLHFSYNHHELVIFTANFIRHFYFDNNKCVMYKKIPIAEHVELNRCTGFLKCMSNDNKLYCVASKGYQYLLYDNIVKQYKYHEIKEIYQGAKNCYYERITVIIKKLIANESSIIIEYVRIQTYTQLIECRKYDLISELLEDDEYKEYVFKSYIRITHSNIHIYDSIEILSEEHITYGSAE